MTELLGQFTEGYEERLPIPGVNGASVLRNFNMAPAVYQVNRRVDNVLSSSLGLRVELEGQGEGDCVGVSSILSTTAGALGQGGLAAFFGAFGIFCSGFQ